MSGRDGDVAIVGGGPAGGLIALALAADRPRILCGKPPVSPIKALRALATSRPSLLVPA